MSWNDDKDSAKDLVKKAKMGIAVGALVVGGVTDAYKGNLPTAEKMGDSYEKVLERERRENLKK